jgi:hypothetical protein
MYRLVKMKVREFYLKKKKKKRKFLRKKVTT